jgi:hypothetical protein
MGVQVSLAEQVFMKRAEPEAATFQVLRLFHHTYQRRPLDSALQPGELNINHFLTDASVVGDNTWRG